MNKNVLATAIATAALAISGAAFAADATSMTDKDAKKDHKAVKTQVKEDKKETDGTTEAGK